MMLPTIVVTFAFRLILAFKVFDEVYLLTGGGPGTATEVLSFTLYQRFFTEDRVGYGSAMSIVDHLPGLLLLIFALSARRRAGAARMSAARPIRPHDAGRSIAALIVAGDHRRRAGGLGRRRRLPHARSRS